MSCITCLRTVLCCIALSADLNRDQGRMDVRVYAVCSPSPTQRVCRAETVSSNVLYDSVGMLPSFVYRF